MTAAKRPIAARHVSVSLDGVLSDRLLFEEARRQARGLGAGRRRVAALLIDALNAHAERTGVSPMLADPRPLNGPPVRRLSVDTLAIPVLLRQPWGRSAGLVRAWLDGYLPDAPAPHNAGTETQDRILAHHGDGASTGGTVPVSVVLSAAEARRFEAALVPFRRRVGDPSARRSDLLRWAVAEATMAENPVPVIARADTGRDSAYTAAIPTADHRRLTAEALRRQAARRPGVPHGGSVSAVLRDCLALACARLLDSQETAPLVAGAETNYDTATFGGFHDHQPAA